MPEHVTVKEDLFTKVNLIKTTLLSLLYLGTSVRLVGFKTDQLVLIFIFNILFYASFATRKFILGFSIFIIYWILFDYMKAFPNYLYKNVDIKAIYETEKSIFGIQNNGMLLTPNEFWTSHASTFLDVLSGFFYLMWVPVPLAFACYMFFKNKEQFIYFSLSFLLINLVGFVFYYIHPAAPPWYVKEHGFVFLTGTKGNPAGLVRFDRYFGIHLFQSIYAKGSNVFAAMPSLHSSYPVVVFYYGIKNKLGKINMLLGIIALGIWFAAVYSSHHYVLDVLAGICCAIFSIYIFNRLKKEMHINRLITKMVNTLEH